MSIQNKTRRLERLEAKNGPAHGVPVIYRRIVDPGQNGPQPTDEGYARILTGKMTGSKLDKMPDETWEEFEARVEAVL